MSSKRIREINLEIERIRIVSNLKKSKITCEDCSTETEFISFSNASQIFAIRGDTLAQMALEKLIHIKLSSANEMLICLPSLLLAKDCL